MGGFMMIVSVLIWGTIGYVTYLIVKSLRSRKRLHAITPSGTCPKCRSEVEAGAIKCASCGSWVVPFTQTPLGKFIVVLIVAVIAFGGVATYIKHRNEQAQRQSDRGYCKALGGTNC